VSSVFSNSGTTVLWAHDVSWCSVLAHLQSPKKFESLIALESVFPNGPRFPEPPMVQISAKRQNFFPSKQAAYDNFKSKKLFADWEDRALRTYVVSFFSTCPHARVCLISWWYVGIRVARDNPGGWPAADWVCSEVRPELRSLRFQGILRHRVPAEASNYPVPDQILHWGQV